LPWTPFTTPSLIGIVLVLAEHPIRPALALGLLVMLIPRPPARKQMRIARGQRFSIISRSAPSSFGFSAAVNASPKNAAFTGSVDSLRIAADAPNGR
jgi:hypothetical protein